MNEDILIRDDVKYEWEPLIGRALSYPPILPKFDLRAISKLEAHPKLKFLIL
jgi:hypothetical protein